ncbi:hypothetical protein ACMFMF_004758 [Clarireedia jacksonii]
MSEGKSIRYSYDSIEKWEELRDQVKQIFDDANLTVIETKSLPPIGICHNATEDVIDKLKKLSGLTVTVNED